jgi:26S proteasome regulatory subunit N11
MVQPRTDTAERVRVSAMALLKMLTHARAGIPLEVIGIMLGRRLDPFTIEVLDVFATPQVATGSFVETTEETFQLEMVQLLESAGYTGLDQVGWYHSHPGFDVWLSETDMINQKAMENQDSRAVAIVVDPVRSVRGKVIIAAFRNIYPSPDRQHGPWIDPREKTSWIGEFIAPRPASTTQGHGLNELFYEMPISFHMSEPDEAMLFAIHRPNWSKGFEVPSFVEEEKKSLESIKAMRSTAQAYRVSVEEEGSLSAKALEIRHVGKVDPKSFIKQTADQLSAKTGSILAQMHLTDAAFAPGG